MATQYTANIVTQQFICNANSLEDAERKYDAFFNGEDCGCDTEGIECICGEEEDTYHTWDGESECCEGCKCE